MKIEVVNSVWGAEDKEFVGGEHEIARPSKALLRCIAAAEHTGSVKVLEASRDERKALRGHVEPDVVSLKAQERAMETGDWHRGNLEQYILNVENEPQDNLTDEMKAYRALGVEHARAILGHMDDGHDYDAAVRRALGLPPAEAS